MQLVLALMLKFSINCTLYLTSNKLKMFYFYTNLLKKEVMVSYTKILSISGFP